MNNDMSEFYRKQTKSQHVEVCSANRTRSSSRQGTSITLLRGQCFLEIISSLRFVVEPKHKRLLTRFMEKISTRFVLWD